MIGNAQCLPIKSRCVLAWVARGLHVCVGVCVCVRVPVYVRVRVCLLVSAHVCVHACIGLHVRMVCASVVCAHGNQ